MTTTQVRPLSGGAWNNVSVTSDNQAAKDTTYGIALPVAQVPNILHCLNEWMNCEGVGAHSALAQKRAAALRLQIQEV
jgi:hypothetical protein